MGVTLSSAAVAPNGAAVIARSADDGRMLFMDLRNPANKAVFASVPANADDVVYSPSGSAALLVYRDSSKVVLVNGLPDSVSVVREFEFANGMPASIAISDDAKSVMAAQEDGVAAFGDGNRWMVNFRGTARSVAYLSQSPNQAANQAIDALFADSRGLWLVQDAAGNAPARLVWEGDAREAAATADRRSAVVLDQNNSLVVVNLVSGTSRTIECACQPAMLVRMSDSVFRINALADGPLWLVDLNGEEARTVFVPPDVKSDQ
jgi:hypothetical protein